MNRNTMEKYRRRLTELGARVQGTAENLEEQARMATGGQAHGNLSNAPMHLGDLGTEVYLQELNATLLENEEHIRDEIAIALQRIEEGTYGTCANCETEIIEERLEILPYTRYCAPCSEQLNSGVPVNINIGRPHSGKATADPFDHSPQREKPVNLTDDAPSTNIEPRTIDQGDVHAVGTPGGGTAIGGLAGTNIGEGNPDDTDLDDAMGSGNFDVAIEEDPEDEVGFSGPSGGAVGGTPAGKRTTGGKTRRGIAPKEPGDSPTGQ